MTRCRVGTSGWNYRHWRHTFYPEGVAMKRWLPYYADHFDTVEVNATFYGLPKAETVTKWAAAVPDDFRFAVKVSRYMTHTKRLLDPAEGWERLLTTMKLLGPKLAVFLAQLPPRFTPDAERLDRFLAAAPDGVPIAVEVRDERWFVDEVAAVLAAHQAALVWSDFPGIAAPEWVTAPFLYVRRHGSATRYAGEYGPRRLRPLANRLAAFAGPTWCYFNNDEGGGAIRDAAALKALLDEG